MTKALFYGAAAAALIGLAVGAALKEPVSLASGTGHQQLISSPQARTPTAVDNWVPTEGAPPPPLDSDWNAPDVQEIEQAIGRMPIFTQRRKALAEPDPVEMAHQDIDDAPDPYLPSARGDILAPTDYGPRDRRQRDDDDDRDDDLDGRQSAYVEPRGGMLQPYQSDYR